MEFHILSPNTKRERNTKQLRLHKIKQHKRKAKRAALSLQIPIRLLCILNKMKNSYRLAESARKMTLRIKYHIETIFHNWFVKVKMFEGKYKSSTFLYKLPENLMFVTRLWRNSLLDMNIIMTVALQRLSKAFRKYHAYINPYFI